MADDIQISYSLDPQGYLVGVNAIDAANSRLAASTGQVVSQATLMSRAWDMVTPKRATLAGMVGLAQQAGALQQNMSTLSALTTTTGSSIDKLGGGINYLARQFPVGQAGARATVEQFTRMGASAGGSTGKVLALAEATIKLSGATGDNIGELAQGMTELSRATGNTNLDPKRFAALGDSLTTVSAQSGASATNVLSFSKSIAPMAQAAGIGATGILGISTAFSKMGEDGLGASTAVSKMLNDMNKSVRDGSPELKTYASMVGQTTEQFTALFKQNPAQALTQITQAIAKAGPGQSGRMLESIGIEGVRGTRAIQSLVSGGGLETAIKTATDAYGSGSTQKASEAAFGGLNDSLTQLRDTSQQLAQALGKPLLAPLTKFTDMLAKPIGMMNKLAESTVGQAAMTGAGVLGGGALLAKGLLGPIGTLAVGKQALSSGPLAAILAGFADSRGASPDSRLGRTSRIGREAQARKRAGETTGTLRTGMLGGVNQFLYDFINPDDTVKSPTAPGAKPGGVGFGQRLRNYGGGGLSSFIGMGTVQLENATKSDFRDRDESLGASGNMRAGGRWAKEVYRSEREGGAGVLKSLIGGLKGFDYGVNQADLSKEPPAEKGMRGSEKQRQATDRRPEASAAPGTNGVLAALISGRGKPADGGKDPAEAMGKVADAATEAATGLLSAGKAGSGFKDILKGLGQFGIANAKAGGSMMGAGLKAVGGGIAGLMGPGMIAGLGISAGMAGYNYFKDQREKGIQANKDWASQDISGTINSYRESIGKSTDTTTTYANQAQLLQSQLAKTAAKGSFADVAGITADDIEVAKRDKGKTIASYTGDAKVDAAKIQTSSPFGIAPEELQAIKVDLLKQMDPDKAAAVLNLLPPTLSTTNKGGAVPIDLTKAAVDAVSGDQFRTRSRSSGGVGATMQSEPLSDEQKKSLDAITEGISQKRDKEGSKYEAGYADDQMNKTFQDMIGGALAGGKTSLASELARRQAVMIGGEDYANEQFGASELQAAGGNVSAIMHGRTDGKIGSLTAPGAVKPEIKQDFAYGQVFPESQLVAKSLDRNLSDRLQKSMSAALEHPEDVKVTSAANQEIITSGRAAGMSLNEMARQITNAASAAGEGTPVWQQLVRTLQEINSQAALVDLAGTGDTEDSQRSRAAERAFNQANGPRGTDQELASARAGEAEVVSIGTGYKQKMQARLQAQYDTDKQAGRMEEALTIQNTRAKEQQDITVSRMRRDSSTAEARSQASFNRQRSYAEIDFNKSRVRTLYDFNLQAGRAQSQFSRETARANTDFRVQQGRAERDYRISTARSTEDYNTSRLRSVRDFGIQAGRAEKDYQTSRMRSVRDFNKSMARQVEDGTKAMLNPYERLRTQATWDIANLVNNLREQQGYLQQQKANLDKARKAGLSDQAIDQLGLGKAENSQQLAIIAKDLNPDTVAQLNAATAGRAEAAASVFTDASNKELARSRDDFNQSLADSEADYIKSVGRSREDFIKSLADSSVDFARSIARSRADLNKSLMDSETDFRKSQARSAEDFKRSAGQSRTDLAVSIARSETDFRDSNKRSQSEFRINLSNTRADLDKAINDMAKDAARAKTNARTDLNKQLGYMAKDLKDADRSITTDMAVLTQQFGKVVNGQVANWTKVFSSNSSAWLNDMNRNFVPQFNALMSRIGLTPARTSTTTTRSTSAKSGSVAINNMADGGTVGGYSSHDRADNIDAKLTAGEFVHKVASVRHYGEPAMRAINEQRVPKELLMHFAEGGYVRPVSQYPSWPHWGRYASGKYHPAVDFPAPGGTPIHSPFDGTVVTNSWDTTGYGNHLRMAHPGGIYTILGHMQSKAYPGVGTKVRQGQVVGPVGTTGHSSGNHVHLEMRRGGAYNSAGSFNYTLPWGMGRPWTGTGFASGISGIAGSMGDLFQQAAQPRVTAADIAALMKPIKDRHTVRPGEDYINYVEQGLKKEFSYDQGGMLAPHGGRGANNTSEPEPVLTGEQWRNISALAKRAAVSLTENDVRGSRAASGVSITVNNNGATTYDNRNDFSGADFTVVSQDPDDMARKLEARATSQRVSQTRGVRRGG